MTLNTTVKLHLKLTKLNRNRQRIVHFWYPYEENKPIENRKLTPKVTIKDGRSIKFEACWKWFAIAPSPKPNVT